MHEWPMERPSEWLDWVNEGETNEQLSAVRKSVTKGQPFGSALWVEQMVTQWNLGATLRARGRPKKELVNNGS
jgi:putative transposase